jgi:uncharacterized protein YgiM (DUF1202 family)
MTLFNIIMALMMESAPAIPLDPGTYPVYIRAENLALKNKPGIKSKVIDTLHEGECVSVHKNRLKFGPDSDGQWKDWYYVSSEYNQGWICATNFSNEREDNTSLSDPIQDHFDNGNAYLSLAQHEDSLKEVYQKKSEEEFRAGMKALERLKHPNKGYIFLSPF